MSRRHTEADETDLNTESKTKKALDPVNEIKELIGSGKNPGSVLAHLKNKYDDEVMANVIFDGYIKRLEKIRKNAEKFRNDMAVKYRGRNVPINELIRRASKRKKKYNFSEDEFQIFVNSILKNKGAPPGMKIPTTQISKTLGLDSGIFGNSEKLSIDPRYTDVLNEILTYNSTYKHLHASVLLQSLSYKEFAPEAMNGRYNPGKDNIYASVDSVLAALFLPKFQIIEERLLHASLANIINTKNEGNPILGKPEFDFYRSMIMDTNDTVCDTSSPIVDLRNRVVLQVEIWKTVLALRQGKYYDNIEPAINRPSVIGFLLALDNCRNSVYDVPDLTYVKDEGGIMRRILTAFSLKPTLVTISPAFGMVSVNPYLTTNNVIHPEQVTMLSLRLPAHTIKKPGTNQDVKIHLSSVLQQPQWFVENGSLVAKSQEVIYSRDLIIIYVNRRSQSINVGRLNHPFNIKRLPMTMSGLERANTREVQFDREVKIGGESFKLKSVVLCKTKAFENPVTRRDDELIIGSCTIFAEYSEAHDGPRYTVYDPGSADVNGGPMRLINHETLDLPERNNPSTSAVIEEHIRQKGTLFVYAKDSQIGHIE